MRRVHLLKNDKRCWVSDNASYLHFTFKNEYVNMFENFALLNREKLLENMFNILCV